MQICRYKHETYIEIHTTRCSSQSQLRVVNRRSPAVVGLMKNRIGYQTPVIVHAYGSCTIIPPSSAIIAHSFCLACSAAPFTLPSASAAAPLALPLSSAALPSASALACPDSTFSAPPLTASLAAAVYSTH